MRVVAILQARMGSTRLPGKALLPIRGIPVAILAAQRARRNGLEVRLATTVDSSDDPLVQAAKDADIPVIRGPIEDVLGRFVRAVADMPDEALVVRLTADNVFPDGHFIGMIVDEFLTSEQECLLTTTRESGLPYGLAAEVFRCAQLREAAHKARTPYEREHVTPWIQATYGSRSLRVLGLPQRWHALRCTIDTLNDYERVWRAFSVHGGDPVFIPWKALCEVLAELSDVPTVQVPRSRVRGSPHGVLVLGTAQLGMPYGRANITGRPSEEEAFLIVKKAVEHGVTHVDTARVYGDSERRIGLALAQGHYRALTIVTKLDPLESLPPDAPARWVRDAVDASVFRSCRELRQSRLDVVLVHRAAHLDSHGGAVWQRLCELRDEGIVGALGASAQSVDEALRALQQANVQYLQIPFNILDRRWLDPHFQEALRGRPDVVVHARSPLLQGLLAAEDPTLWPRLPGMDPRATISDLKALAHRLGRRDVVDLALAYVRGQEWIHGVVLGVESVEQLVDAAKLMCLPALSTTECKLVEQEIETAPEGLVNPALWPPCEPFVRSTRNV